MPSNNAMPATKYTTDQPIFIAFAFIC
jgi:hypothetical protein